MNSEMEQALLAMGTNLRDLRAEDVPTLMACLVTAASEAVGDLTEQGLAETEVAAHDLADRERMRRHFFDLGRLLLDKERARALRDAPEWFE